MEITSLFSVPLARVRIDKYFKDEAWYLKKGYELNSIECIAIVEYIEEQVAKYMKDIIGTTRSYEVDNIAVVTSWQECSEHFSWTRGDVVAQGVLSLEVPGNLCKLAVYCFTGMRDELSCCVPNDTAWFQTSAEIPMAANELIIVPGDHNPDINGLNGEPGLFVVFNIKV